MIKPASGTWPNPAKGFGRAMEEQEIIGCDPKIIEMAILIDECPT
jgi:hypothetical protein